MSVCAQSRTCVQVQVLANKEEFWAAKVYHLFWTAVLQPSQGQRVSGCTLLDPPVTLFIPPAAKPMRDFITSSTEGTNAVRHTFDKTFKPQQKRLQQALLKRTDNVDEPARSSDVEQLARDIELAELAQQQAGIDASDADSDEAGPGPAGIDFLARSAFGYALEICEDVGEWTLKAWIKHIASRDLTLAKTFKSRQTDITDHLKRRLGWLARPANAVEAGRYELTDTGIDAAQTQFGVDLMT